MADEESSADTGGGADDVSPPDSAGEAGPDQAGPVQGGLEPDERAADLSADAAPDASPPDAVAGLEGGSAETVEESAVAGGEGVDLPNFGGRDEGERPANDIDMLHDVNLRVKIELGRTRMLVEDVLKLGDGSVVELDKLAGDPVDVFANERLIARGEVLVLNDNFCVRISEIVPGAAQEPQLR